jgi:hypothetical protein
VRISAEKLSVHANESPKPSPDFIEGTNGGVAEKFAAHAEPSRSILRVFHRIFFSPSRLGIAQRVKTTSSVSAYTAEKKEYKMKELFYRSSSRRPFAGLFSMDAQLDGRKRVIFPKRLVFAVVALAAFVSLGALLLPQVVQAQCVWDCDLGSDPSNNPWGNSPQSQLDIAYCIDRDCVITNFSPLIGSLPSGTTDVGHEVKPTCGDPTKKIDVRIFGPVVAMLRDGNLIAGSAAQAFLDITIKCVTVTGVVGSSSSILSRVVVPKELRTNVFAANSSITILAPTSSTPDSLKNPSGWTGCPTNKNGILNGNCAFPLGIVEFNNNQAIAKELPAAAPFLQGEVFRAEESTRFVGVRDCKGDPNGDSSTIACSVGGGQSLALLPLTGNWSGATNHTFNPTSGSNPYDITTTDPTDPSGPPVIILPGTVVASANGGIPIFPTRCNDMPSQKVERCFFIAKDFNVVCKTGDQVNLLVTGQLQDGRKFQSTDPTLTCSNK